VCDIVCEIVYNIIVCVCASVSMCVWLFTQSSVHCWSCRAVRDWSTPHFNCLVSNSSLPRLFIPRRVVNTRRSVSRCLRTRPSSCHRQAMPPRAATRWTPTQMMRSLCRRTRRCAARRCPVHRLAAPTQQWTRPTNRPWRSTLAHASDPIGLHPRRRNPTWRTPPAPAPAPALAPGPVPVPAPM
jgi:hypothetical protein